MPDRIGDAEGLDGRLQALVDSTRASDAVESRRRRAELQRQASEAGSFTGILTDLAERAVAVAISLPGGRSVRGRVSMVGVDHIVLVGEGTQSALVALRAIATVVAEPGSAPPTVGRRTASAHRSLLAALGDLAGEHRPVVVRASSGDAIAGTVEAVGVDVVTVRSDTGRIAYLHGDSISDVTLA